MRSLLPALVLAACTPSVPASCASMCQAAVPLQRACLAEDGLDFSAVPAWGDADGFVASCETWAWESVRLDGGAATRQTCEVRNEDFRGAGADCSTWEAIDWEAPLDGGR